MSTEMELKQESLQVSEQVNAIMIKDAESFALAGNMIIALDQMKKKIVEYWKGPKDAAYKAHKEITAKETEMLKPIDERRRMLNGKMSAWATEQERIRREEQRRVDEARRKQEDEERRKLEERARKAEEKGKAEKAEELREKAEQVYIPPVVVVPEVEKTTRTETGTISTVKDIAVDIIDPMEIVKAVAAGTLPIAVITINEAKLKAAVKMLGIMELHGLNIREVVNTKFRGK